MQNAITATSVFYAGIEPDLADSLRKQAERIRERTRKTTAAIIEIGRDLLAVKETIPHGMFGPWLKAEFTWDERTARRYMTLTSAFADKTDIVSDLPQRILLKLASPSRTTLRAEVLDRLERGQADLQQIDDHIDKQIELARRESSLVKKKEQAAYRRSKRARDKEERRRKEREETERREREKAEATAQALIEEFGLPAIMKITAALDDFYVSRAIHKLAAAERLETHSSPHSALGAGRHLAEVDVRNTRDASERTIVPQNPRTTEKEGGLA